MEFVKHSEAKQEHLGTEMFHNATENRRSANYKPSIWKYNFLQSLTSKYDVRISPRNILIFFCHLGHIKWNSNVAYKIFKFINFLQLYGLLRQPICVGFFFIISVFSRKGKHFYNKSIIKLLLMKKYIEKKILLTFILIFMSQKKSIHINL